MSTFSVNYVGQLRYYECMKTHKSILEGAERVSGAVIPFIKETWKGPFRAKHSIDTKDLNNIISDITSFKWINQFLTLSENKDDYLEFTDTSIIHLFPCEYFITLVKSLGVDTCDFNFFITTDLIFFPNEPVFKNSIENYDNNVPTAYVRYIFSDRTDIISTLIICINKLAKDIILKNWKHAIEIFLKEDHPDKFRNEYATLRLFELCGIKSIKRLDINLETIRFRDNMSLDSVTNLEYLKTQAKLYSAEKEKFIYENNKRKQDR